MGSILLVENKTPTNSIINDKFMGVLFFALLEPNETRFCSSYHLLFAQEQEKLQTLFESTDEMPDQDSAKSCSSTPPQKKVEKTGEFNIKKSERIAAKKK